jgi:uncharacterized protein YuzB (UPF0349 family)
MKVSYCKKCHDKKRIKNIKEVNNDIKSVVKCNEVTEECQSYCGPGSNIYFVTIEDEIIEANSYDELINNLKEKYDN